GPGPPLHPGGRVPAPHRTDAGRLMGLDRLDHPRTKLHGPRSALPRWEMVVRQRTYWATVYRRTWKGSVVTSFVMPLLYVVAMGVLLGGIISTHANTAQRT